MDNIITYHNYFYHLSETFIYRQVKYLKESFNVYLVSKDFTAEPTFDFTGVHKIKLNRSERAIKKLFEKVFNNNKNENFRFYNHFQLSRLIKEKNIKLIHAHFGIEALHILPVAMNSNIPLVVSFHGFDASRALLNKQYADALPALFNYASKIIVSSKHMIDNLKLQPWSSKVIVLPYNIDTEEFKPVMDRPGNNHKIQLLHSGRIVAKKGVPDLITVFHNLQKKHSNIHLTVLGAGPELSLCRKKVSDLKISNVSFLGAQNIIAVKKQLDEADIFILNSRVGEDGDMEGTPVSILEAMSMGKAVVSTYHAGIPDVIKDGINGLLVPEKNNEELEKAISKLIMNPDLRMQIGITARNSIMCNFSNDKLLPLLEKTLSSVIKN